MKRTELAKIVEKSEIQSLIDFKFDEWEAIRAHGASNGFTPDGYQLNCLRGDIIQLRNKLNKLYDVPLVGQLSFWGDEAPEERAIPALVPFGWMSVETDARRTAYIEREMESIFQKA